ncbi:MAG TPA: hypothetical protein VEL51_19615 [Vicinamibacterales bacterium]|nr:hypothetical protein [Vicinamibacterales bacterium]
MLTVVASLLIVQAVAASPVCSSELPVNIQPGLFRPEMVRLLEQSRTSRQQCTRIAAARYVRVVFGVALTVPDGARAQSVIERFEAGAIVAHVTLKFSEDYLEIIPHELEHVIEQIERVQLRKEVAAQRAWEGKGGAFETKRAIEAGIRVRQEVDALAVEAIQADTRKPPAPRHSIH